MKPYRPSSGTEGADFEDEWCAHCTRDAAYRDGGPDADPALGCQILADALCYDLSDAKYPKQWVRDPNGRPICTAFTTDPRPPERCKETLDLFEEN